MKILVLDDVVEDLYLLRLFLNHSGYEVVTHSDCYRVIEIIKDEKPQLIILNVHMSDFSCVELLVSIKKYFLIPVIVICSHEDTCVDYTVDGADAILIKPLNMNSLLELTESLLKKYAVMAENNEKNKN